MRIARLIIDVALVAGFVAWMQWAGLSGNQPAIAVGLLLYTATACWNFTDGFCTGIRK